MRSRIASTFICQGIDSLFIDLGIARDSGTGLSLEAKVFLTEFHIDEKIPPDF